jgi:hypothetical protein
MTLFLTILGVIAGVLLAIPLSLWATHSLRRSPKRSAGLVVASALLLSFPFLGQKGPELIEESQDTMKRKKDAQSGEPPQPPVDGEARE